MILRNNHEPNISEWIMFQNNHESNKFNQNNDYNETENAKLQNLP